jgi:hypothetical protein
VSLCKLHTSPNPRKHWVCDRCHQEIHPPNPYRWWQGRFTRKFIRCMDPACTPFPWELETNVTRSDHIRADIRAGQAREDTDPALALAHLDEAIDLVDACKETLENRVEGWSKGGLANSQQYAICENTVHELDVWLDNAREVRDRLDTLVREEDADETLDDVMNDLDDLPELDMGQ